MSAHKTKEMTPIFQNMSEAISNLTGGVKEVTREKSSPPICSRIEAAKRRAKPVLQRSQHLSRPAENGDRVRCNKPCRKEEEEEEEEAKLVATKPEVFQPESESKIRTKGVLCKRKEAVCCSSRSGRKPHCTLSSRSLCPKVHDDTPSFDG
jgi:hypothetical protein